MLTLLSLALVVNTRRTNGYYDEIDELITHKHQNDQNDQNDQFFNAYDEYDEYNEYDEYYETEETDFDQIKSGEGALIWTGFDIQWRKRLIGFMTPHRISKLGSYIDSKELVAGYTFGPGVDGDYAYPLTKYKSVIITDKNKLAVDSANIQLKFEDTAQDDPNTKYPMADTGIIPSELIPKPTGSNNAAIVLNGFEFIGNCSEVRAEASTDTDPNKKKCNSDGIWAYIWDIGIKEEDDKSGWKAYIHIARTKNTAKAKNKAAFKPFNYFMDYELKIYYTVFSGEGLASAQSESITGQDQMNIKKGTEAKFVILGQKDMDDYVIGINKFKFTLSNPEDMGTKQPRGRYFEGLVYGIDQESLHYNDESGEVAGNVYMNVYGAKAIGPGLSSRKSIVDYEMGLTLLQFASKTVKIGDDEGALGSICQSGNDNPLTPKKTEKSKAFGMNCAKNAINLPEQLFGNVNIESIQQIPEPGTLKCKGCVKPGKKVCGEDGITYANKCYARCYCVKIIHKGKCKSYLMQDIVVKNNKKGEIHICKTGGSNTGSGGSSSVKKKRVGKGRKRGGKGRKRGGKGRKRGGKGRKMGGKGRKMGGKGRKMGGKGRKM
eukprot:164327_1